MSFQRLAEAILVDWRDAEHRLGQLHAASTEAVSLRTEVVELRSEYEHLIDAARRNDKPVPPPFPSGR